MLQHGSFQTAAHIEAHTRLGVFCLLHYISLCMYHYVPIRARYNISPIRLDAIPLNTTKLEVWHAHLTARGWQRHTHMPGSNLAAWHLGL